MGMIWACAGVATDQVIGQYLCAGRSGFMSTRSHGISLAVVRKLNLIIVMNLGLPTLWMAVWIGIFTPVIGDQSAPPAIPIETRTGAGVGSISAESFGRVSASALQEWSIGTPTDEEQYYLELVNRTRADPAWEAARLAQTADPDVLSAYSYFKVNLTAMSNAIASLPAVPPLAMSRVLADVARDHTKFMFNNQVQTHDQNGVSLGTRATTAGYDWIALGESVYSYADSVYHGYAGFEVDWGDGPSSLDGMQNPPGHRVNNHSTRFREVGIGVVLGTNGPVGPQLVTMDFGDRPSAAPLMTGVVYYDLNGNHFYDPGEGVGGVRVDVSGSGFFATTSASGGYAVPCSNGVVLVGFSAPELPTTNLARTVSGGKNVKADLSLNYVPPVISGPSTIGLGAGYTFVFPPVLGALSYEWFAVRHTSYATVEGAETGLSNATVTTSAGYAPVAKDVKASGSASFHLAHVIPEEQSITLKAVLHPSPLGEVRFATRLGLAGTVQTAALQVSVDGGSKWTNLWTQTGTGGNGEGAFKMRTNSLAAFSGRDIRVRFAYSVGNGSYYAQAGAGQGFYVDDISFVGTELITTEAGGEVPSGKFSLTASSLGDLWLRARPKINSRTLPYGPVLSVQAVASVSPPVVRMTGASIGPDGKLRVAFHVVSGVAQTIDLERVGELGDPWSSVIDATLSSPQTGDYFFSGIPEDAQGFFRVRAR